MRGVRRHPKQKAASKLETAVIVSSAADASDGDAALTAAFL